MRSAAPRTPTTLGIRASSKPGMPSVNLNTAMSASSAPAGYGQWVLQGYEHLECKDSRQQSADNMSMCGRHMQTRLGFTSPCMQRTAWPRALVQSLHDMSRSCRIYHRDLYLLKLLVSSQLRNLDSSAGICSVMHFMSQHLSYPSMS